MTYFLKVWKKTGDVPRSIWYPEFSLIRDFKDTHRKVHQISSWMMSQILQEHIYAVVPPHLQIQWWVNGGFGTENGWRLRGWCTYEASQLECLRASPSSFNIAFPTHFEEREWSASVLIIYHFILFRPYLNTRVDWATYQTSVTSFHSLFEAIQFSSETLPCPTLDAFSWSHLTMRPLSQSGSTNERPMMMKSRTTSKDVASAGMASIVADS